MYLKINCISQSKEIKQTRCNPKLDSSFSLLCLYFENCIGVNIIQEFKIRFQFSLSFFNLRYNV